MIYIQSILYHIKLYWKAIVTALLVLVTVVLALVWSCTQNHTVYCVGVGTGITAVLVACIVYANEICKVMDWFGLREVPEDEERSINNAE